MYGQKQGEEKKEKVHASQTIRQSDNQTIRQSDNQTVRQSDNQTVRQSDSQTITTTRYPQNYNNPSRRLSGGREAVYP